MENVLRRIFSIGDVPAIPVFVNRSVRSAVVRTAIRRGDVALVSHQAVDQPGQIDLFFGSSDAVLAAAWQRQKAGDPDGAAQLIWESAEAMWQRGAILASSASMLTSLQTSYNAERFDIALSRSRLIEAPVVSETLRLIAGIRDKDADEVLAAGETFAQQGRFGLAIEALRTASVLYSENRDPDGAAIAVAKEHALRAQLSPLPVEGGTLFTPLAELSDREREVARLAAQGLSNQQIARDLVLSVRTVESHMYNSLRKLGLNSRQSLQYYREKL